MNITGIITEYNPFHNGHKLHLEETKRLSGAEGIICVMSGNFVQRGLPAILDKWTRARMAVLSGVDLVVELPTVFAVSSAEFFAKGAVDILTQTSVVNSLCFGSEAGDTKLIRRIAEILCDEPAIFREILKKNLSSGNSFVKARSLSLIEYFNHYTNVKFSAEKLEELLSSSNNILAIEYCKSIIKSKSSIEPLTIKRIGSSYNDKDLSSNLASATAIRELLYSDLYSNKLYQYMPEPSANIIMDSFTSTNKLPSSNDFLPYIKYKLLASPNSFSKLPDSGEGLDNKFLKEINTVSSVDELIMKVKSKRYTYTRLTRLLCQYFLGFEHYDTSTLRLTKPNYLRVLALNTTGAKIIKEIKKASNINIISKVPKKIEDQMLQIDINASNIYSLINPSVKFNSDYLTSPFVENL
jgi:predicted nucleotidyltransferase